MNLEVKNQFHGFTVRRIRPIPGQAAELVEMIYDKTKTELVWVKNHAENKLFATVLRTSAWISSTLASFMLCTRSVIQGCSTPSRTDSVTFWPSPASSTAFFSGASLDPVSTSLSTLAARIDTWSPHSQKILPQTT